MLLSAAAKASKQPPISFSFKHHGGDQLLG
jgi:hypothetical protein